LLTSVCAEDYLPDPLCSCTIPVMEAALRVLRIVRYAMLASIVIYCLITERALEHSSLHSAPSRTTFYAITLMAVFIVASIFSFRRKFVPNSETTLVTKPADAKALRRWRAGYLVVYGSSEAVALYGVVLRFMGFTLSQVLPFYLAGFVLLLFFVPRRPSNQLG
jgi:FtsH-binding integral membrane protein